MNFKKIADTSFKHYLNVNFSSEFKFEFYCECYAEILLQESLK